MKELQLAQLKNISNQPSENLVEILDKIKLKMIDFIDNFIIAEKEFLIDEIQNLKLE